ncbi:MAG: quinolinate synthase NadA [Candidatus Sabulitectum sp.]|nr:quinolinate synthase NadA [Candidatus Sabulitectum sp.]
MPNRIWEEIERLKKERGAIILAHSYQPGVIQDIADFVGDSLELSRIAARESAELVIFCGVKFMAETAKLLSPESTVVLAAPDADCSLAACMSGADLREMKRKHPGAEAVMYVNSTIDLKAETWACCTSANSVEVVEAAPSDEVIFGPDRNLGTWVASQTDKTLHIWPGGCHAHSGADIRDLREKMAEWPDAEVLVHPESPSVFLREADEVLGTGGMIRHVEKSRAVKFIIGTEEGMIYRLETLFPDRQFLAAGKIICDDMGYTTPELVLKALESQDCGIQIPAEFAERAEAAVRRMTEIGG